MLGGGSVGGGGSLLGGGSGRLELGGGERVVVVVVGRVGAAGVEVPLKVLRGTQIREVKVRSIDRVQYFRSSATY